MKLTGKLSKIHLKRSKEGVTGRMGLSWIIHSLKDFGLKKMVQTKYRGRKKSNRSIDPYKKIVVSAMTMLSAGQRVEDVEVLRKDCGLLESLGWDEMVCADTQLNFISDVRNTQGIVR